MAEEWRSEEGHIARHMERLRVSRLGMIPAGASPEASLNSTIGRGMTKYVIKVKTGDIRDGSTDANVYIKLVGKAGSSCTPRAISRNYG
jgi:hypothetical protein